MSVLEAAEFAGEVLESSPAIVGICDLLQGGQGLADFKDEEAAHGFMGVVATVVGVGFGGLFGEAIEPFESLLVPKPILIAAAAPFGEVLVGNGFAGEKVGEDGLGFREMVQPFENGASEFAVVKALIKLFTDFGGEAGDFADSSFHGVIFLSADFADERRFEERPTGQDGFVFTLFGFYFHFKREEKLTVMFSEEGPDGVVFVTRFFGKRGRNRHIF